MAQLYNRRPGLGPTWGAVSALLGLWLLWACVVLGVWGTVAYVAWHFISKYW